MRTSIIIVLLSSLLYWGQAAPAPSQWEPLPRFYNYNNRQSQFGIFPLAQTVQNRPPGGFFYFPLMPHIERDNLFRGSPNTNTRVKFTKSLDEVKHSSPGYDGTTKYGTELDQETTFEAGPGKHVLMQFNDIDIEEGRQYEGCIYDWVEVRSNKTAITEAAGDKYCATRAPSEPILSKGNEMSVLFHSDRVNEGTGFSATLFEVSKVEEDSFVENYENWGPAFSISFDLMILKEVDELQSIFAFLGRHFANVPQILLDGLNLRFTTSYPLTGKKSVKYETEVDIHTWMSILIETKLRPDNTFDFVISVGRDEHTVEDVSAKAIEDVSAWDTHYALKPAGAVYKNLVIDPTTSSVDTPEDENPLPPVDADGVPLPPPDADGAPLPPLDEDGVPLPPPDAGGAPLPPLEEGVVTLPPLDDDIQPEEVILEEVLPPAAEDNNFGAPEVPFERNFDKTFSNVGVPFIPFAGFKDWIQAQTPVYTVAF